MLLMLVDFAGRLPDLKIACDAIILCLFELNHELDIEPYKDRTAAENLPITPHILSNDQPLDTSIAALSPSYSQKPIRKTEDENYALAAATNNNELSKLLKYHQGSRDLHLPHASFRDRLLRIETMVRHSWLAELRTTYDRMHVRTPQDVLPSSLTDRLFWALMPDEDGLSGNSTGAAPGTPGCTQKPEILLSPFYERIHGLPPEIFRMIKDAMFQEAFGPERWVYPYEEPAVVNIFLALDRRLYQKYSDIYWCENTWVIGQGPVDKTMRFMSLEPYDSRIKEFSLQIPNRLALGITRIHIPFGRKDVPTYREWLADTRLGKKAHTGLVDRLGKKAPMRLDDRLAIQRFQSEREYFRSTAFRAWQDKFDRLAVLNLTCLTLDMREAFAPDGEYVGVDAVERFIPFAYGLPDNFTIEAPSKVLIKEIRNVFDAINTH